MVLPSCLQRSPPPSFAGGDQIPGAPLALETPPDEDALATRVGLLQDASRLDKAIAMGHFALLAARQAPDIPTQEKEPAAGPWANNEIT